MTRDNFAQRMFCKLAHHAVMHKEEKVSIVLGREKKPVAIVHIVSSKGSVMFTGVLYDNGFVSGSNGRDWVKGTLQQLQDAAKQFSGELKTFSSMETYLAFMHHRIDGVGETDSHGSHSFES